MKKIIPLLIAASACCTALNAQHLTTDKVPAQVGKAYRTKFPAARQDSWAKDEGNTYNVVFFNGKKKQSATFDETGKWIETETEMGINQAPLTVTRSFMKEFNGFNIQDVYEQERPDSTSYEITIVKGRESYDLLYSAKGVLLKKAAVQADGE